MLQVVEGFAVIWAVIGVGYLLGRFNLLGEGAQPILGRLAYWTTGPAMMFEILSKAKISEVFSAPLLVAAVSAGVPAAALYLYFRARGNPTDHSVIGALTGSYANVGNLGLPFATFVLGSPAYLVPPMIFQLVVLQPLSVAMLDVSTSSRSQSALRTAGQVLMNPMIWGTALGLLVSVTGIQLPMAVSQPIHILAQGQVAVLLIGFGLTLVGARILAEREGRQDVLLSSAVKILAMPAIAWATAQLLHLDARETFIVVVLAALPTAQNVLVTATRYGTGRIQAKESILLTTVISGPIMVALAGLLT